MKRLFLLTTPILALAIASHLVAASVWRTDGRVLLQPHTLHENFQHDSLGQFASYPPAQDFGYEPSLAPTADDEAPGGRALMRVVKPNRTGALRFGFIRQPFLQMTEGAKLAFAYRLNHAGRGDQIEIGLAGADHRHYLKRVPAGPGGWIRTEVQLADFRGAQGQSMSIGTRIEAFYIIADLKQADPDITYRLLIDDLALTAARPARFEVRQPLTANIDSHDAIASAKSFNAGEKISVTVSQPARLERVRCTIETQDGKSLTTRPLFDDGTHGDRRAGDGEWANDAVYLLRAEDPTGVWTIKVEGATATGEGVATKVRFIHRPAAAPGHPRLYFSAADKGALTARTRHPRASPIWEKILSDAKTRRGTGEVAHGGQVFEMLDQRYLLPSLLGYFDVLNRARLRIEYNALVAYLADDAEARDSAKTAMLEVARWSRWEPPWFTAHGQHTYYPAGQLAAEVAFGYDLLYHDLTAAERSLVRRALIEKSIIPVYREYVLDDRVPANTSNWIGHTVGGALIAAAAIAGDVTGEEAKGQFDLYLNGLLLKMERHLAASYLADGSYGEGISYQEFDLETTAPALVALGRVFGIDYWRRTRVRGSLAYSLYTFAQPVSASPDMGDSHPPTTRTIAPLVAQTKDPVMRWFYEQFPHTSIVDFLFFDDSPAANPPQLPTSRLFREKGNAIFRTGWNKDDWVLLFRAGANFNHNHADQGSFLLSAFGEPLITEAGWSDYYKDPYYATFFTQAIGHNTVLVDGNPESQNFPDTPQFAALDRYPRLTDAVTSEFHDAVSSDLTSVYRDRLSRYRRSIVFVKPHYFVVFDDLASNGEPAKFDWLLHLPDRSRLSSSPGLALYTGAKASLAVRMLAPADAVLSVRNGRLPYGTFAANTPKVVPPQPAFLDLQTTKPASAMQFLVALVPARAATEARALAARMTEINRPGLVGLRAERGNERDLVMFRTFAASEPSSYEDWMTDAAAWTVTQSGDRLMLFAAQQARSLSRANRRIFTSDNAVSIAAKYSAGAVEATCEAPTQTNLQLSVGSPPLRVLLDGREAKLNYDPAQATVSITVPMGQHQLRIERR